MIIIDEAIKNAMKLRLGVSVIKDVKVKGTPTNLTQELTSLQEELSKNLNIDNLASVPRILSVRTMLRKLAVDPSYYRPSSEALVRRVLTTRSMYYLNSAVDVKNYCSLKFLLPLGLYDLDKIEGTIYYKIVADERYESSTGDIVYTDRNPFLTDDKGVFGNPTAEASRTAVTLTTKNLLSVIYAAEDVSDAELTDIMNYTNQMFLRYNSGYIDMQKIIE